MERIKSRAVFEKFQERLKKTDGFYKRGAGSGKKYGILHKKHGKQCHKVTEQWQKEADYCENFNKTEL